MSALKRAIWTHRLGIKFTLANSRKAIDDKFMPTGLSDFYPEIDWDFSAAYADFDSYCNDPKVWDIAYHAVVPGAVNFPGVTRTFAVYRPVFAKSGY